MDTMQNKGNYIIRCPECILIFLNFKFNMSNRLVEIYGDSIDPNEV